MDGRLEHNLTNAAERSSVSSHYPVLFQRVVAGRMQNPAEAQKSSFKFWAYAIFISVFLCFWLSGMTAGLMAGACKNYSYEGAKKLRFCNISLVAGAWMDFSSRERAKRSRLELERGIALSQMGEPERAVEAFEEALRDARATSGPWERAVPQRMVQIEDRNMLALWMAVVEPAQ